MTNRTEHGEAGHINRYLRDHETWRTGHGAHDRIMCFNGWVRVDDIWKLGEPSNEQIVRAYCISTGGVKCRVSNVTREDSSLFVDLVPC